MLTGNDIRLVLLIRLNIRLNEYILVCQEKIPINFKILRIQIFFDEHIVNIHHVSNNRVHGIPFDLIAHEIFRWL